MTTPAWAINLLANLAAYVFAGGHPSPSAITSICGGRSALATRPPSRPPPSPIDPVLGTLHGPFGAVEFLQVVGLDSRRARALPGLADQRRWSGCWRPPIRSSSPVWTDRRCSTIPSVRELAEAGVAAEGSSLVELRVATLRWATKGRRHRQLVVTMGGGAAAALGPALRRRLTETGAAFEVIGESGTVRFIVADQGGWAIDPAADGDVEVAA